MLSHRRSVRSIRRCLLVVACSLLALTSTIQAQDEENETVVSIDRFLLRLGPRTEEFDLQEKVTVLWTIENLVREYFEVLYDGSTETLFEGAGITGLSVVPPEEEEANYETIKFLGGAVTFDAESTTTPTDAQMQSLIESALDPDTVIDRLTMYFPELTTAVFVPLELGNRGFGNSQPEENTSNDSSLTESYDKPKTPVDSSTTSGNEDNAGTTGNQVDGVEANPTTSISSNSNSNKTMIGLSTGVAVGGAIIVLLVGLLIESRRRRMDFWRESSRDSDSTGSIQPDMVKKTKPSTKVYTDDEQEPSLRLPRLWGVTPSRPMDSGTSPGSSDNGGDSIQEILTCTSMDRRSIQNVESFEHQKRLVDTLKKEMMTSNTEIHPYIQATHLDNTEPCALSPTDLSAAALENDVPSRVPAWPASSDSSFTGSGSGYDSPTSPLRVMMRNFQLPGRSSRSSLGSSDDVEF